MGTVLADDTVSSTEDVYPNGERLIGVCSGLMPPESCSLKWSLNDQTLPTLCSFFTKLSFNAFSVRNLRNLDVGNLLRNAAKRAIALLVISPR